MLALLTVYVTDYKLVNLMFHCSAIQEKANKLYGDSKAEVLSNRKEKCYWELINLVNQSFCIIVKTRSCFIRI